MEGDDLKNKIETILRKNREQPLQVVATAQTEEDKAPPIVALGVQENVDEIYEGKTEL
jgi:hypothetical protein